MAEEDKIQKEIARRLAAESETETVVPAKNPARETWESANPGGDYDEAMKGRAASPANVVAGDADPYDALAAAEKRAREEAEKNKSSIPGLDFAKSAYGSLPDDVKPYVNAAAGYVGGKALRSILPQDKVYGTPEYREIEKENRQLSESQKPAVNRANQSIHEFNAAQNQHHDTGTTLGQQRSFAEQQHLTNLLELQQAQADHAHAQTLSVEDELARRANPSGGALPAPTATKAELTPQARGGEGSSNYAVKFGATDEEARRVPSMSVMQKENIPNQAQAWDKISKAHPSFDRFQESPLLLGEEGQKAVRDRETARLDAEQKQQARAALERKQLADDLARHKAAVQIRLENAQKAASDSEKARAAAIKAHDKHAATAPVTPAQIAAMERDHEELRDLQDRIKKAAPSALARVGTKIAPRFIPGAGAAFAPIEAEAALEEWKKKNYGRAAVHGLGSVGALAQATGVPWLMGAGDIAQIPAAGLALYDMATESEKQK